MIVKNYMIASDCLWDTPPAQLTLLSNDIHIWCAALDLSPEQIKMYELTLSADEKIRAERFHFERHKYSFIASRGILRAILSRYLNIKPHQLQFEYGTRGKPEIAESCSEKKLKFNLSHSDKIALYAITTTSAIGIDIEKYRPLDDAEQIAERFFTARECAWLSEIPPSEKQAAFFSLWTCKEAYLKAIGEGLAFGLDRCEIGINSNNCPKLLSIQGDSQAAKPWFLQQLNPVLGYVGAVAVKAENPRFTYWQWPQLTVNR
ncbi:MAG TPA: 4'-phosphopantetheinyl transferase superfamily protein [Kamptonema sp.]|nr:4'-phosphopantetheinyl transferase superfamily protein [Kamptonema sp.]